ncbi:MULTISPECIES: hypothetical protein [Shimia]|uniref:hypothetical protein n=1 Tax=Shimia TaxID=573139 RepID=UPI001FB48C98|nr:MULTISPECIES: hypothetical protein [Shimia]MDV4145527.1 hypothetical protein [Shimia sp. FJ5]
MSYLRVTNLSRISAEIEGRSGDLSEIIYLAEDEQKALPLWRFLAVQSVEPGVLRLELHLPGKGARLDMYRISENRTLRQRSLIGPRKRRLSLRKDEMLMLIPTGEFE